MFGVTVGYTRGTDNEDNYDDAYNASGDAISYNDKDDKDWSSWLLPSPWTAFLLPPTLPMLGLDRTRLPISTPNDDGEGDSPGYR
jgi:hypothetical protein